MNAITLTPELVAVLSGLKEMTEIRNLQGKVVGIFTPAVTAAPPLWSEKDLAEAERALEEQRHLGRPLKEFWEELRAKHGSA